MNWSTKRSTTHWLKALVLLPLLLAAPAAAAPTVNEFEISLAGGKPYDIVLGPDGKLWFTEDGSTDKIGRVTPGNPPVIDLFDVPADFADPLDITVGPDNQIWFNGKCNNAGGVGRINPANPADKECHGGFGITGQTRGIAAGAGSIWVGDPGQHRLVVIDPATGLQRLTSPLDLGNDFTGIKNIVLGPDGNLWLTEFSGKIGRVTPEGILNPFPVTGSPWDIVPGPDNNLWFTSPEGANAAATRITTGGTATPFPVTPGGDAHGIAVGPDGALWVAQAIANTIGRVTTSGDFTEIKGLTAGSRPENIAPGPENTMWFTEQDGNRIGRISGIEVPGGGPGPGGGGDTTKPDVTRFRITRKAFRAGGLGTVIRWSQSEAGTDTIGFERRVKGRWRKVRRKMRFQATAGDHRLRFRGRIDRKHPLRPGRYRMTMTVKDAAGNVSTPDRTRFKLLPKKRR
jgi:streptogramin lyase